ncbi:MAG: hypothetical protein QOF20_1738 [Acidimicrobiaceae bacterium]|nr:hypothetical protein [Acidimicrobiaceae bacterium]
MTATVGWLPAPGYWLARLLIQRALAGVYLIAFVVAANQFRPLLGERGLLPVPRFVARVGFWRSPSIFQLHYSDRFFLVMAWTGSALALACVAGLPERGPLWCSMVAWLVLWGLYLSIVNVGQRFYSFGWETLLLEAGFIAVFLGPANVAPPTLGIVALRWLLFRLEFGAGLIKLRGDPCWRDLTCLFYHHETQPLPGPLSWYFHHLPPRVHKAEVLGNHFAQLVAPALLFAPQPVPAIAGAVIVITQAWLVLSGNFAWLNVLTIVLAFSCFSDRYAHLVVPDSLRPAPAAALAAGPGWWQGAVVALALLIVVLSRFPVRNMASRRQMMNSSFDPFHLVNTYGAFGRVTKRRYEVVIEGTDAAVIDEATPWREYQFKGKPGDPKRRPPQVAPYHLRLDWLMWFVPLSRGADQGWLVALLGRLVEGDRAILKLLGVNPVPDQPPQWVRASLYHYRFSSRAERRQSGAWWVRTRTADLVQPLRQAVP